MGKTVRASRVLPGTPALVWRALTDRALIAEWLMPNDFEPVVGHRFTMTTDPAPGFDGTVHAEVLALEPERGMTWRWRGGPVDTTVEFVLEPIDPEHTRVTVIQSGFVGLRARVVGAILGLGWRSILRDKLPAAVARVRRG